jgi:hypothetical protein
VAPDTHWVEYVILAFLVLGVLSQRRTVHSRTWDADSAHGMRSAFDPMMPRRKRCRVSSSLLLWCRCTVLPLVRSRRGKGRVCVLPPRILCNHPPFLSSSLSFYLIIVQSECRRSICVYNDNSARRGRRKKKLAVTTDILIQKVLYTSSTLLFPQIIRVTCTAQWWEPRWLA